jgi:hypothetical protein
MAIALQAPIVTSVTNLAVTFLNMSFGALDAQTVVTLGYAPSNASGVISPGAAQAVVTLAPADIAAFQSTVGTPRQKAEAALQSNLGAAAAGSAT